MRAGSFFVSPRRPMPLGRQPRCLSRRPRLSCTCMKLGLGSASSQPAADFETSRDTYPAPMQPWSVRSRASATSQHDRALRCAVKCDWHSKRAVRAQHQHGDSTCCYNVALRFVVLRQKQRSPRRALLASVFVIPSRCPTLTRTAEAYSFRTLSPAIRCNRWQIRSWGRRWSIHARAFVGPHVECV